MFRAVTFVTLEALILSGRYLAAEQAVGRSPDSNPSPDRSCRSRRTESRHWANSWPKASRRSATASRMPCRSGFEIRLQLDISSIVRRQPWQTPYCADITQTLMQGETTGAVEGIGWAAEELVSCSDSLQAIQFGLRFSRKAVSPSLPSGLERTW